MSNEIYFLLIAYMSLCVGTFIGLRESEADFITTLLMSVLLPIPVFAVLMWAAISVARDKSFERSTLLGYLWLFVVSIATYSEAVAFLKPTTTSISEKPVYTTNYKQKIRTFPFTVRRGIATNLATT